MSIQPIAFAAALCAALSAQAHDSKPATATTAEANRQFGAALSLADRSEERL